MDELKKTIIQHEGISYFPYKCPAGKITIGVGRNIQDNGISHYEAMVLFENDLTNAMDELSHFDWFICLNSVRKGVLAELNFNIGLSSFFTFKKMISALEWPDYDLAATELVDSKWASQVGERRATNMAHRLRNGLYPA